jgi:hypothetical protein
MLKIHQDNGNDVQTERLSSLKIYMSESWKIIIITSSATIYYWLFISIILVQRESRIALWKSKLVVVFHRNHLSTTRHHSSVF